MSFFKKLFFRSTNMSSLKKFIQTSYTGRIMLIIYRLRVALSYYQKPFKNIFIWLFTSREFTNFTYDLTSLNKNHLISFVSNITGSSVDEIEKYISEVEEDLALSDHVEAVTMQSSYRYVADTKAKYARKLGWYAVVRAIKPKVVVEAGTDKGLSACLISKALQKNDEDGFSGFLYTVDKNPEAGYLFTSTYQQFGTMLTGDIISILENFPDQIDLFIHDTIPALEKAVLSAVNFKLSKHAFLLSNWSHATNDLMEFAKSQNKSFLFFCEQPDNHWYPGGGIGAAYPASFNHG